MAPYAVSGGRIETSERRSKSRRRAADEDEEVDTPRRRSTHRRRDSTNEHSTSRPRTSRATAAGDREEEASRRRSTHRHSTSRPRESLSRPRESRHSSSRPRTATAAASGESSRPRRESSSRPRRESSSRPQTAGDASSRPRTGRSRRTSQSPTKKPAPIATAAPREAPRAHTYRYEPLPPTVRAVGGDQPARRSRYDDEPQRTYDGTGETPDARLMGGLADAEPGPEPEPALERGAGESRSRRSRSAPGGGAAASAKSTSRGRSGKNTSILAILSGLGGAARSRAAENRPVSMDSMESGDPKGAAVKKRQCGRCFWILLAVTIILLIIIIPVAVVVSKKKGTASSSNNSTGKYGEESKLPDASTIPTEYKNTYLDPYTWLDTTDFNLTFTSQMVGGLSVMGLFNDYDDTTRANDNVPPLNEPFPYGKMPIRGVNVGGWLILEPFITPSYFEKYANQGVVDESTLSKKLGATEAKQTIETHYKNFVTESTFKEIRDAGLDHVRIPFGYWAVRVYDGDPFVPNVAWRYLLRAIEWARKYGLRVKLDLHSAPGGQNGWNHSGMQGVMNWLSNTTEGRQYGQDTLEIHNQLSQFFAQPRYKNIVTLYGLVNEPKMTALDPNTVITWSEEAYKVVRKNGYNGYIVFGDGFRGLATWKGAFEGYSDMVLDVHQYVIFNVNLISFTHSKKIDFACNAWGNQMTTSVNTATGFGPTIVGEWGQADTDCTPYLNNVGVGSRWEGTLNLPAAADQVLIPQCPGGKGCNCTMPNGSPSDYPDAYRQFLLMFAEAQMNAFEKGWGWLYWTWDTESATQWSYKKSLAAQIVPQKAYSRSFNCDSNIPDFASMGLTENDS
ncbi:glycoside hydrolase superfamily [Sphaerosporella brunnea]|uniref:glucan 1,3-beta-glucosidase n=1 Tax=Sphaerosporella brunnea TaxID=1250544 RepID=A0A5J5F277_9PEZI|nr:glycoside hydrolase superfamily [Sphaerosporella brunnea]